ncbi:MAG TPA: hypothetical protein VJM31_16735 [Vicinamibacterales bacterium]|nr:hypothetical protein [Vicinamibacterales bacterium]
MNVQPALPKPTDPDQDKGAVEGDHAKDKQQGNRNAQRALDKNGMPKDRLAIAEDVIGANADKTQG